MTTSILAAALGVCILACGTLLYFFLRLQKSLIETDSKLNMAEQMAVREKESLEKTQAQLTDTFKSLAATALEGNNQQFLTLARAELEKKEQSVDGLVKPLSDSLKRYETQIREMEKHRERSFTSVENELQRLVEVNRSLSHETNALKDALKRPHVRGRWGEVQLKNCVELAGMSEFADVVFQDSHQGDEGLMIPDMTVRMPGGRVVVVDAKTPIEAFIASLEASTDEERRAQMIRHSRHIKEHIKKLSSKAYNEHIKESADFTVLFLPNESFLYAALETDPGLIEYAIDKKILVATPPTLIGLLKVIRYGWNEERLAENAEKISVAGQELHKRVCDFMESYVAVGKGLEKASDQYNKGLSRLQSRVLTQARRLEELGAKSKKELPEGQRATMPELPGPEVTA